MATSGSKDFAISRSDIVEGALRKLGVYDIGEPPSGDDTAAASMALNLMVKEWAARGADIFLREEVTLFLQPQSKTYLLGSSGTNATKSYVETTLSAAEATSQTTISVTSETGMTIADNIGIKLDDDSIHWSTIASLATLTINHALPSAAASGNKVYAYTTKAQRPQKLIYAFRRDTSDIDTEVTLEGEIEYQRLSSKSSEGPPVLAFYRPSLTNGTLHVWPVDGGSSVDKMIYISQVLTDDFDSSADNPQFPIEWGNALVWGLASELAPEYGLPRLERRELAIMARQKLDDALDYDVENADVIFTMGGR